MAMMKSKPVPPECGTLGRIVKRNAAWDNPYCADDPILHLLAKDYWRERGLPQHLIDQFTMVYDEEGKIINLTDHTRVGSFVVGPVVNSPHHPVRRRR
jgi:hypothetical protein